MRRHSSEIFEEDSICKYSFTKKKKNYIKKPKLYLYSWTLQNNRFRASTHLQQKIRLPIPWVLTTPDKLG